LDILRCVSATVAKLSSWRCENNLIKASWHLRDKSKNRNYQNHKISSEALHEEGMKSSKKGRSLAKPRRENRQQKIGPCNFIYLYDRR